MSAPGWPAELSEGPVRLRPLRRRDARAWCELRRRNAAWLTPWESTLPFTSYVSVDAANRATYRGMLRMLRRQARAGVGLPFAIDYDGRLAGQVTVSSIVRGSLHSASVGYWVDEAVAGHGVAPTAVALVVDHCFSAVGLHRVELNVRPENTRSRRVAEKLGFREEGVRLRYLHIDRDWRDHLCFALTVEEVPGGLLRRYRRTNQPGDTPSRLRTDEQRGR
ncbi:MAG: GNAT family N-acetyltransferase [Actinomycetes bacterium]